MSEQANNEAQATIVEALASGDILPQHEEILRAALIDLQDIRAHVEALAALCD